jgi:signal recognition particle subunit SRP54
MTGQDAANTARAFNEALPLTGVILTKVDGDARGGAALSVRQLTGKPIKFIGVGEKVEALEIFHPERIASRILGQGDLMTLAEEAKRHIQPQDVEKMAGKIKKGQFSLADFRDQIKQMQKMGGLAGLMSKMPGMSQFNTLLSDHANDRSLLQIVAIIDSMTPKERNHVELLLPPSDRRLPTALKNSRSRIQRVANGSGTDPQMVKRTLKQFSQMQKMMKKQGGMLQQLSGRLGGSMPNLPGLSGLSGLPGLSNMAGKMPDLEKLFKDKG